MSDPSRPAKEKSGDLKRESERRLRIPLPPDEAMADLLKVPPPPEKKRRGKKADQKKEPNAPTR